MKLEAHQFMTVLAASVLLACAPGNDLAANKAVVRGYMEEILNRGNYEVVDHYFPPEGFVLNGRTITKDQLPAVRQGIVSAFPDFRVTIEEQIAEGDLVVTRVTFTGTHEGEFHKIPSTGRLVRYTGIAIDRVVDGKVVEGWHEANNLGLLEQLRQR